MRQCSPILLFTAFIFFLSCQKSKNLFETGNNSIDSISLYLKKADNPDLPDSVKIDYSNKALKLAKSEKIDSLIYASLYLKIQNSISFDQDSLDKSLKELKAISGNDTELLAGYNQQKALSLYGKNNDSSYLYHEKAKELYLKLNDSLRIGYNLIMMSEIQMAYSDYNEVQTLATEALSYLKNQEAYISTIHTLLGLSYSQLHDYENAIESYEKAISFTELPSDKKTIENNIGIIYKENKQFEKAIAIFKSLNNDTTIDTRSKARILDNLGHTLFLNGDKDGLQFMEESVKIKNEIADDYGLIASHLHLSEYFLKSNLALAKSHALKAISISEKLNNEEDKLEALKLLSKTTQSKIESDKIFSEYTALNEKITSKKDKANNQFSKLKYDSKEAEENLLKEKARNAEMKLVAERARNKTFLAIAFIIILVLAGYLFFKSMRFKHTRQTIKEIYNTETRISKKVHDELANDVYNIMNFATNQNLETSDKKESLLTALDSIYNRTRDISRENSPIDLGQNYPFQLKQMLSDYQTEDLNVLISENEEINWNSLDETKKVIIFRILQELMINMKKHSEASLTMIKFDLIDKNLIINYSDNGIGFEEGKSFYKNGLQNVENRISGINGTITFDKKTKTGVKIKIDFPY